MPCDGLLLAQTEGAANREIVEETRENVFCRIVWYEKVEFRNGFGPGSFRSEYSTARWVRPDFGIQGNGLKIVRPAHIKTEQW